MIIKPKGTYDIYGIDMQKLEFINMLVNSYADTYNFKAIRTPIFESSELFHRSVGETSDIVTKETYDFVDRGDRKLSLRPEGTASIVRSYIENKMYGNKNDATKLFYNETMYRYERPQSGRNREFTQFGFELFGSNNEETDAELISLGYHLLNDAHLNKNIIIHLNSLGDNESRSNYQKALVQYLEPYLNELCEDCQKRIKTNPLRILDCKVDAENPILKKIPKINDYLSTDAQNQFKIVCHYLNLLDLNYEIDSNLVRGLDYYDHTIFEYITDDDDKITLGGGGRYNSLVKELGGPDTPAIGFACGIERIMNLINNDDLKGKEIDAYLMSINEEEKIKSLVLSDLLRLNNLVIETNNNNLSMKSQFKIADELHSKFIIILNSEDLKKGLIKVKDNLTKEETLVDENEIVDYLLTNI